MTDGTTSSATQPTPTPSSTASSITPTASNSAAKACAEGEESSQTRLDPTPGPMTHIHRPARLATRAASSRYGGRHHPGISGGIKSVCLGGIAGSRMQEGISARGKLSLKLHPWITFGEVEAHFSVPRKCAPPRLLEVLSISTPSDP